MKHFWQGFGANPAPIQFKKHIIVLFWSPDDNAEAKGDFKRVANRYPSIKVKVVNVKKDPLKPEKHKVTDFPTVLLLKDGREVDRVTDPRGLLLEQLFRKANT